MATKVELDLEVIVELRQLLLAKYGPAEWDGEWSNLSAKILDNALDEVANKDEPVMIVPTGQSSYYDWEDEA